MAREYTLKPRVAAPAASGALSCPETGSVRPEAVGLSIVPYLTAGKPETPKNPANEAKSDFLAFCYDQAPVVGFRVMKNDVVTVRAARNPEELAARLEGAVRGEIEDLSMKSRRRLALVAGNSDVVFRSFLTLTYPAEFPCDGKRVKRDLQCLMKALRRKLGKFHYLWFLEFQKRGAPHFHIFCDRALPEPLSPMTRKTGRRSKSVEVHWPWQNWLSAVWYEIVGSGDERHIHAGAAWEKIEKPDGAARYVAKESYKTFQKVVPPDFRNVGRFWGTSRGVSPDEGKMVYASKQEMAKLFPPECFDENGNPYPVLFSAVEKSRDAVADHVKKQAWKRMPGRQADMITSLPSSEKTDGLSQSSGSWIPCAGSKEMFDDLRVRETWHGSVLNSSKKPLGSRGKDG